MAFSQVAGDYDLSWYTVDSGGGSAAVGGYTLIGTIGQPDPGQMTGGGYSLEGGFWSGSLESHLYLPLVIR